MDTPSASPAVPIRTSLTCRCGGEISSAKLPGSAEAKLFLSAVASSICSKCHSPIQVQKGAAHLELVSS